MSATHEKTPGLASTTGAENAEVYLLDRREAARRLGVSPGTIDNLRARGELPSVKIGARRLFHTSDLIAFIGARKAATIACEHAGRPGAPEGGRG
jgi:excisionase family DNA binding protein